MGNNQAKEREAAAQALMSRRVEKEPTKLVLERAVEERESHAVLTIPKTNYKVMYVDPAHRGDVVGPHGYIALAHQRPSNRRSEVGRDLRQSMFGAKADAKRMREEIAGDDKDREEGDAAEAADGAPAPPGPPLAYKFPVDSEAPTMADGTMVVNGERVQKFAPGEDPLDIDSFVEGRGPLGDEAGALAGGEEQAPVNAHRDRAQLPDVAVVNHRAGAADGNDEEDDGGDEEHGAAFASGWANATEMKLSDLDEHAKKEETVDEAMQMDFTHADAASESGSRISNDHSGSRSRSNLRGTSDKQRFFYPRGAAIRDRVFFVDDRGENSVSASMGLEPSLGSNVYELEEDEIHEMAGVHRMTPRLREHEDDPLATYHVHSDILDALYMVIDAPIQDLRTEDIAGEEQTDEELRRFRDAALKEAKELFDTAQNDMFLFTQGSPRLHETKSSRLLTKSSFAGSMTRASATNGSEGNSTGARSRNSSQYHIDLVDEDGNPLSDEAVQRQKVRERKRLHKSLNAWKAAFRRQHDRDPDAHELASDPEIRDVYAAYKQLKKETKEKEEPSQADTSALNVTDAATGQGGSTDVSALHTPHAHPLEALPGHEMLTPQRKSLAPLDTTPDGVPLHEDVKAKKKELKQLQKVVKQWKKEYKAATGAAPTKGVIRSDEAVGPLYDRLKQLEKELEGSSAGQGDAGSHDGGSERDESEVRVTTTDPLRVSGVATPSGVEMSEDLLGALHALEDAESIDRRELHADENIEYRALERHDQAERPAPPPTVHRHDSIIELGTSLRTSQPRAPGDPGSDGAMLQPEMSELTMDPSLHVGAQLQTRGGSAAHAHNHAALGWGAASPDLQPDEEQQEELRDGAEGENGTAADRQRGVRFDVDERGDGKALAKRRKHLAKELNAWKAQFAQMHGRQPTVKDIRNDAEIAPIFEEYNVIPKDAGKDDAPGDDGASPNAPDDKALAKRRKHLAKELNAWKAQFAQMNGREPITKDILGDESARPIYEEYITLRSGSTAAPGQGGDGGNDGGDGRTPADGEGASLLEVNKRRRRQLGKELNDWKNAFAAANGRQPTTRDIKDDPAIFGVFEQYSSITKDGEVLAPAGDGAHNNSTGADEALDARGEEQQLQQTTTTIAAVKRRKKQLGKELNAWKANFESERGLKPKVDDIRADSGIAPLYDEYNSLLALIKSSGGGDGDLDDTTHGGLGTTVSMGATAGGGAGAADPRPRSRKEEKAAKKRRKELTKLLQEWRDQFEEANARAAEEADVAADTTAAAWYTELEALGSALEDGEADKMDGTLGVPSRGRPGSRSVSGSRSRSRSRRESGSGDAAPAIAVDPQQLQKRRKELAKQLNKWKSDFQARTGEHPTKKDIDADPSICDVYREYTNTPKEALGGTLGSGAVTPQRTDRANDDGRLDEGGAAPSASPQPRVDQDLDQDEVAQLQEQRRTLKAKKKELARELNAWKEAFAGAHGHNPKKADIAQDSDVSMLYEELEMTKEQLEALATQLGSVGE